MDGCVPRQQERRQSGGGVRFRSSLPHAGASLAGRVHPALLNADIAKELRKITGGRELRERAGCEDEARAGVKRKLAECKATSERSEQPRKGPVADACADRLKEDSAQTARSSKKGGKAGGGKRPSGSARSKPLKKKGVEVDTDREAPRASDAGEEGALREAGEGGATQPRRKRKSWTHLLAGEGEGTGDVCEPLVEKPLQKKASLAELAAEDAERCKRIVMFWADANKGQRPVRDEDEALLLGLLASSRDGWLGALPRSSQGSSQGSGQGSSQGSSQGAAPAIQAALAGASCVSGRLLRPSVCPPPLTVGLASDRLGLAMHALCVRGGADDSLLSALRALVDEAEHSPLPACLAEEVDRRAFAAEAVEASEAMEASEAQPPSVPALGRRGRSYRELWAETDFLRAAGARQRAVSDWTQLLRDYSDSHDGCYRDWALLNAAARRVCAPPVPANAQHPASWGPGARREAGLDPSRAHPACCSLTPLAPPGAAAMRSGLDLDDLDLDFEQLLAALARQEMANFARLRHVLRMARSDRLLNGLQERSQTLEEELVRINATVNSCPRPVAAEKRATVGDCSSFLGACELAHVPHARFVLGLRAGDAVEVCEAGAWTVGSVVRTRFDGPLLRGVKVALSSSPEDRRWLAVEDALLAPPGAHLALAQFEGGVALAASGQLRCRVVAGALAGDDERTTCESPFNERGAAS